MSLRSVILASLAVLVAAPVVRADAADKGAASDSSDLVPDLPAGAGEPAAGSDSDAPADDSSDEATDDAASDSDQTASDVDGGASAAPTAAAAPAAPAPAAPAAAPAAPATPAAPAVSAKILVLPYAPVFDEVPQSVGDKAASLVKGELTAGGQFEVVDAKDDASPKAAAWKDDLETAKRQVTQATALFDKANELAQHRRIAPAAQLYEKGIQQFLVSFQGAADFQPLSEAYLQLSIARFKLGQEEQAMKLLDDLIRVDPSRELKPGEVVNLFVKLHEKARAAYLAKPRGVVKVLSTPAGAEVTLDGRKLGETPLVGKGVVPGEHYLFVQKEGEGAYWKKIDVQPGEELDVKADLTGGAAGPKALVAGALGKNAFDAQAAAAIRKLGEGAKADYVLFGALHKGDDAIAAKTYALQVSTGKVQLLAPLQFDLELIGADIEVFKLTSDLAQKVAQFEGASIDSPVTVFSDAEAPSEEDSLNEVVVTGAAGAPAVAENEPRAGHRRGPVTHADAEPAHRPVVAPAEETKPVPSQAEGPVESTPPAEEKPKLRPRVRIGDEAPAAKPVVAAPAETKPDVAPQKDVLEEVEAEATGEAKAAPQKPLDVRTPPPAPKMADLSPEELARLNAVGEGKEQNETGKIVLWSGVGVVGAAALAYLGYALLSPKTPTSATATISWNP